MDLRTRSGLRSSGAKESGDGLQGTGLQGDRAVAPDKSPPSSATSQRRVRGMPRHLRRAGDTHIGPLGGVSFSPNGGRPPMRFTDLQNAPPPRAIRPPL